MLSSASDRQLTQGREAPMFSDPWFYGTVIFAVAFGSLLWYHIKRPYPLIQFPELPHHIYFTNPVVRRALVRILQMAGHEAYGRFKVGADQILCQNGTTVIALKMLDDPSAALVIPVIGKLDQITLEREAMSLLQRASIRVDPIAVDHTKGLIRRLRTHSQLGFDIVFRPPGRTMGRVLGLPKFDRNHAHF